MNLPAEDEQNNEEVSNETTEAATPTASGTEPSQSEQPARESESKDIAPLEIGYTYESKSVLGGFREHLQELTMLRDDLFLSILAITLLNAVIFLFYTTSGEVGIPLKEANQELRTELGREADFLTAINDFINIHGEFSNPENSEFNTSLARFRSRLSRLGVETSDMFFLDEFMQKNGGLYWSKKSDRAPTEYQPVSPMNLQP